MTGQGDKPSEKGCKSPGGRGTAASHAGVPPSPVGRDRKNWAEQDRNEFHRCYNEAEELFLLGKDLSEISDTLKVTVERLQTWNEKYDWPTKLVAMMTSPAGIAAILRERLRKEVQVTMVRDKLNLEQIEQVSRMTTLINKIEDGGFNFLAAASMVLRRFSSFLRQNISDKDEYHNVSTWVQNFLRTLTDV
jgi:hypothetical protein